MNSQANHLAECSHLDLTPGPMSHGKSECEMSWEGSVASGGLPGLFLEDIKVWQESLQSVSTLERQTQSRDIDVVRHINPQLKHPNQHWRDLPWNVVQTFMGPRGENLVTVPGAKRSLGFTWNISVTAAYFCPAAQRRNNRVYTLFISPFSIRTWLLL